MACPLFSVPEMGETLYIVTSTSVTLTEIVNCVLMFTGFGEIVTAVTFGS